MQMFSQRAFDSALMQGRTHVDEVEESELEPEESPVRDNVAEETRELGLYQPPFSEGFGAWEAQLTADEMV